jgi:NAD(P)H-quinone oxidoreductase subunit H
MFNPVGKTGKMDQPIQQAQLGINLEICSLDREKEPEWNDFQYQFIGKKSSSTFELPK